MVQLDLKGIVSGKIYILLPVHNRREITRRFLTCLKAQTHRSWHLVLIDDGSTDGTAEMVPKEVESLSVITGKGEWWWGGSLEQGYRWVERNALSMDDFILIINDDTEFDADFLRTGIELLSSHPLGMLVACCYSRQTGEYVESGTYRYNLKSLKFAQTSKLDEVNCMSTRGLFLRVDSFLKTGGFYPRLLPHYLSDIEFTLRAIRFGLKPLADPKLKVYIDEETTGHRLRENESFFVFVKKYFSKKCDSNPVYFLVFALLACPGVWKVINVFRIGYSSCKVLCGRLLMSLGRRLRGGAV